MSTEPQTAAESLESIRRALAVAAADRPTPEQIAEWNTADKEMAQRIRAALPGVPLHHAYAVLQALRVTQRLDAAAPAAVPPADRAYAEAVQYWYDAATERRAERDRLRAVVARLRQMTDHWEQQLPDVIRTPAVVSAIRAALERADDPAAGTPQPETQAAPRRGDAVEQWLKTQRDEYQVESSPQWGALDEVLDTYRLHADTGTPLGEHVCEGRVAGDCDCLEKPAAFEADLASKTSPKADAKAEIVHGCPPDGSGLTPCCGRTPFELPLGDRMSSEAPVTCTAPAVTPTGKEA